MKKRLIALLLTGFLAVNGFGQDLSGFLKYITPETDTTKYIPDGVIFHCTRVTMNGVKNKIFNLILYDKNGDGTYVNPDGSFQDGEAFIDIDGDFIADIPFDKFYDLYEKEKSKQDVASKVL